MKRPNVDVEETRRQKEEDRMTAIHQGILVCIAIMEAACDEKAGTVMMMLDLIAARVIHTLSKEMGMSEAEMIATHSGHVHNAIKVLKEKKK